MGSKPLLTYFSSSPYNVFMHRRKEGFCMARVRFDTTLRKDLLLKLKHEAIERGIPVNRILENMAENYYANKETVKTGSN